MNLDKEAENAYYAYTKARGLLYPWHMLDENTKEVWRKKVAKDL